MLAQAVRKLMWRRRLRAAHAWRDEQRAQYDSAIERVLGQSKDLRDPCSRLGRRAS